MHQSVFSTLAEGNGPITTSKIHCRNVVRSQKNLGE